MSFDEGKSYNDVSDTYSDFYGTIFGDFFLDIFLERIKDFDFGPDLRILDLGCGHCTLSYKLAKDLDVCEVKCVDRSEDMIREAKKSVEGFKDIFSFSVANLEENADFESEYDIVLIQSLMCRIENPANILQNASESLSEDGKIILSYLPRHQYALSNLKHDDIESFEKTIEVSRTKDVNGIPIRVFSKSEIKSHVSDTNLSIEAEYPVVCFLNYLDSGKRKEVLEENYELLKQKEVELSRETSSRGLRNVLILS